MVSKSSSSVVNNYGKFDRLFFALAQYLRVNKDFEYSVKGCSFYYLKLDQKVAFVSSVVVGFAENYYSAVAVVGQIVISVDLRLKEQSIAATKLKRRN